MSVRERDRGFGFGPYRIFQQAKDWVELARGRWRGRSMRNAPTRRLS
jgi:hypothetical protein